MAKINSSGTAQWIRVMRMTSQTNGTTAQWQAWRSPTMMRIGSDDKPYHMHTFRRCNGIYNTFLFQWPIDGSKQNTYTIDSDTIVLATSNSTITSSTTNGASSQLNGNYTNATSASLTSTTSSAYTLNKCNSYGLSVAGRSLLA